MAWGACFPSASAGPARRPPCFSHPLSAPCLPFTRRRAWRPPSHVSSRFTGAGDFVPASALFILRECSELERGGGRWPPPAAQAGPLQPGAEKNLVPVAWWVGLSLGPPGRLCCRAVFTIFGTNGSGCAPVSGISSCVLKIPFPVCLWHSPSFQHRRRWLLLATSAPWGQTWTVVPGARVCAFGWVPRSLPRASWPRS